MRPAAGPPNGSVIVVAIVAARLIYRRNCTVGTTTLTGYFWEASSINATNVEFFLRVLLISDRIGSVSLFKFLVRRGCGGFLVASEVL